MISQVVRVHKPYIMHTACIMHHACWPVAYKAFFYQFLAKATLHVVFLEHVGHTPDNQQLEPENHPFEKETHLQHQHFGETMLFFLTFLRIRSLNPLMTGMTIRDS